MIQKLKAAAILVYLPWPSRINTRQEVFFAVWALYFWSMMIAFGIMGIIKLNI